ncbi:hypothetical protein BDW71DRAFT_200831 [Aspergillus fruticulosus]
MIPNIFMPPLVFAGLLIALWKWKCAMIGLFRNRLLYMSYMPPFARSEKIADYHAECRPAQWKEMYIRSLDGTTLAACVGSTPPRLPLLSSVLRELAISSSSSVDYTLVALSYRGYWKSSGRASQTGIEHDTQAFLDWIIDTLAATGTNLQVILWGHSLKSAIVSTATAAYLARLPSAFSSSSPVAGKVTPPILLLVADEDEMIPSQAADELERLCQRLRLNAERQSAAGALHTEAVLKRQGKEALIKFIRKATDS